MPKGAESKAEAAAHKKALSDTWAEIQALEMETDGLLSSVRDISSTKEKKKTNMKTGGAKNVIAKGPTTKRSRDDASKGKKSGSLKGKKSLKNSINDGSTKTATVDPNAKTIHGMSLDIATATAMDKTRQLYEDSIGRVTIEVWDDASPDATPRGEEEQNKPRH